MSRTDILTHAAPDRNSRARSARGARHPSSWHHAVRNGCL